MDIVKIDQLREKSRELESCLNSKINEFKQSVEGNTVAIWTDGEQIRITLWINID